MSQHTSIQSPENRSTAEAASIRQPSDEIEHLMQSLFGTISKILLSVFLENKMDAAYGTMVGLLLFVLRQVFEPWLNQHQSVVSFAWLNFYWAALIGISLVKLIRLIFFRHNTDKETRKTLKLIRQRMRRGELTRKQAQGLTAQVLERHIHSPRVTHQQKDGIENGAEVRSDDVNLCFRQSEEIGQGPEQKREPVFPVVAPSLDVPTPSAITESLPAECVCRRSRTTTKEVGDSQQALNSQSDNQMPSALDDHLRSDLPG